MDRRGEPASQKEDQTHGTIHRWTFASWIVTHLLCREMHMRYQQCSDSPQRKHKEVVCRGIQRQNKSILTLCRQETYGL
jgi:hypothetical protein